jgi:predicted DNA-binding protein (UPF0251 family)
MELEPDLVAVKDAATALGISRPALDKRLAARGLEVERRLVRGRVLVFLRKETVEALAEEPSVVNPDQPESTANQPSSTPNQPQSTANQPARLTTVDELEALRLELHALRVANARLEGELAAAVKIEASTSRFADKLEEKLEALRLRHADEVGKLQRENGRQEAAILLLREQERERGSSSWLGRLLGR